MPSGSPGRGFPDGVASSQDESRNTLFGHQSRSQSSALMSALGQSRRLGLVGFRSDLTSTADNFVAVGTSHLGPEADVISQ
jgi:hypothetical protein